METDIDNTELKITWDKGTAYDFFASLRVLHQPAKFGLRGAWAAGVRSRLSQEDREFLENADDVFSMPYIWVISLPAPKDVDTVLYTIKQIPAAERLSTLMLSSTSDSPHVIRLKEVMALGSWDEEDRDFVISQLREKHKDKKYFYSPKRVERLLDYFANSEDFGRKYLTALQSYNEVFFAEEENRIAPKIEEALSNAQNQPMSFHFLNYWKSLLADCNMNKLPRLMN